MGKDDTINTIHRYLLNDLSDEEKNEFEARINANEAIKKKVAMEKRFLNLLDLASDVELKNTISSVHGGLKEKGFFAKAIVDKTKIVDISKRKKASRMLYAIAAALALVIAAWLVFDNEPFDATGIYASNYSPEKTLIETFRENGFGSASTEFEMGLDQYSEAEFMKAKNLLLTHLSENPDDSGAQFYIALCEMELNGFDQAVNLLVPLTEKESIVKEAAKWYLGLAYLNVGKQEEAKAVFKSLTESKDSEYKQKAIGILQEWQ